MLADYFTKPLQGNLFKHFRDVIIGKVHTCELLLDPDFRIKERVEKVSKIVIHKSGPKNKHPTCADIGAKNKRATYADIVRAACANTVRSNTGRHPTSYKKKNIESLEYDARFI